MSSDKPILAGVIGSPIGHSKSPRLHGYWLEKYGINGRYVPLEVSQRDLPDVLRALPKMGFAGANVTIPHKEAALNLADKVTDRAALIGAANTLVFRESGQIIADNTDGHGFTQNIKSTYPDWDPSTAPIALFGAGGAARAAISALIEAGAQEIRIANRTRARADALKSEFGAKITVFEWVKAGNMLEEAKTVVNCSALGMKVKPELKVPLDGLESDAIVSDIVYVPLETRLLKEAAKKGCRTVDGLGMLLHQAAPGFERWFGRRPEITDELRALMVAE